MNSIKDIFNEYEKLLNQDYLYHLENGQIVELTFKKEHLPHLLGLQYLTDIPLLHSHNGKRKASKEIYNLIKKGIITDDILRDSIYFSEIENRFEYINFLDIICNGKIIFNFNKNIANTYINANLLIYHKCELANENLHIFIKRLDKNTYVPVSFFKNNNTQYIKNQNQIKVTHFEVRTNKPKWYTQNEIEKELGI